MDLPDLPIAFYPWVKEIGEKVGKVLGKKPNPNINPKWDPYLFVELDIVIELKENVKLYSQDVTLFHSQRIFYKNLPNACFKCHKQGHMIKDCPELAKEPLLRDAYGFTTVQKKKTMASLRPSRQEPSEIV